MGQTPSAGRDAGAEVAKVIEGELWKPHRRAGGWAQRWFVLLETGLLLSCKRRGDALRKIKPVHQLCFTSAVTLTQWGESDWATFEVETEGAFLHLRAADAEQRQRWVTALRTLCYQLPVEAPPPPGKPELRVTPSRQGVLLMGGSAEPPREAREDHELPASELQARLLAKDPRPVRIVRFESGVEDVERERTPVQTTLRDRLIAAVRTAQPEFGVAVLVLDDAATRVLSSACRLSALFDEGIGVLESLERRREPVALDAVYVLSPDYIRPEQDERLSSMQRLVADFARKRGPLYSGSATVLLLNRPAGGDGEVLDLIENCPPLKSRIRGGPINLSCGFLAPEPHLFTLDLPRAFSRLYAPEPNLARDGEVERIAARLAQTCLTLNEYPYIRFPAGSPLAGRVAALVQEALDAEVRRNEHFWYHGMQDVRQRATLLVTERCADLASVLCHEFTLQAMASDVLAARIDGDMLELEGGRGRVPLTYFSKAFRAHRHKHIHDVAAEVMAQVAALQENPAARLQGLTDGPDEGLSLAETAQGVAALGEFQKLEARLAQVSEVAQACMRELQRRNLLEVAEWEQGVLTGVDSAGAAVKPKGARRSLLALLPAVEEPADRARLLALFAVVYGSLGEPEERRRLLAAADLADAALDDALIALTELLGDGVFAPPPRGPLSRPQLKQAQAAANAASTLQESLSRFQPPLKGLLRDALEGSLSEDEFPFIVSPPPDALAAMGRRPARSARSARRSSRRRSSASSTIAEERKGGGGGDSGDESEPDDGETELAARGGARYMAFVAGGVTHAELRAVCELGEEFQRDVLLGTTSMATGGAMMEWLASWGGS